MLPAAMSQEFDDKPVPLAVAAALAYNRLRAPEAPQFYDPEHFSAALAKTAQLLIQIAPVYLRDESGTRRRVAPAELEGAEVRRGATVLLLADGRKLTELTIRRGDFFDAVAALKAAGGFEAALRELQRRPDSFRTTS
jgi:hypothetical protein